MSLALPTKDTPILCQGITSDLGTIHTEKALAYGANIVAGVARDKNMTTFLGVPIFQTVQEAVDATAPKITMIFSSPLRVYKDIDDAINARIPLIICMSNQVPYQDILKLKAKAMRKGVILMGPSAQGFITIGQTTAGIMPTHLFEKGNTGIISRSGSLLYEIVYQLKMLNIGVSTCFSLGSSAILGCSFIPPLKALLDDKNTKNIVIVGKINGDFEIELAKFLKKNPTDKKIVVYLMGTNAGGTDKAPVLGAQDTDIAGLLAHKKKLFKELNIATVKTIDKLGQLIAEGK